MTTMRIERKHIRSVSFVEKMEMDKVKVYEIISWETAQKLGFKEIGDVVTPSAEYGITCYRNVNGYTYAEKNET